MDMNNKGGNSYYDVERLCNEAVERNFRGDPNAVGSVISQATYDLVWHTFVKWCQSQADVGRAVNMAGFGIIGFQQVRENIKILYVRLSENFMAQNQISYKQEMMNEFDTKNVVLEPLTKPNFANMAKISQLDKSVFQTVLQNILHVIGELLSQNSMVEIDLQEFGKFWADNRQVLYDPLNKLKQQAPQGKQTVKALMDFGVSGNAHQAYYSHQQEMSEGQMYMDQMYASQGQRGYGSLRGAVGIQGDSPPRRYKKPFGDGKITKDLLGAGDDPEAKNMDFSLLANNPTSLMKMTFKKPGKAQSRYPPVIDAFSRTLAAPISSERHYFSVCHKIGTNFSPSAKGFYIDSEARVIKFKNMNDGTTKLDIVGSSSNQDGLFSMVEPADEQEEYEALIYPEQADHRRIKARKVSYSRYRQYVENEISVDVIAPIRQYWLTHIIELIPGDLHAVEKERIEYLIDTMLNEINKDYFDSVRKSILDYILKNESEMRRLGIQQVLNQPIEWGEDYYKGIEPNEEWKHNVMMARMLMSENLCICSQATLELMKLWQDYNTYNFVEIPAPRDEPKSLVEFLAQQEGVMSKVKGLLSTDWNKGAVDILREELENLDKDQTKTFFESVATLMANQVRELIEQSVNAYVDFIQRYKLPEYPKPDEIIKREYDPDTPFEDNFIALKLKIDGTRIVFSDPLESVQKELEDIIDNIVKQSSNLPRPENQIARSDKMHLWDVQKEDELVHKSKAKISETLKENLDVVALACNVYDDFLFILQERERIETFIQARPQSRETYQDEINKLKNTIERIREEMPFEIRMNMFLIQCSEINNALCEECNEIIQMILRKVSDFIFTEMAPEISQQVKGIQEELGKKSNDSAELVDHEKRLENIKMEDQKRLVAEYDDMIEWLIMLNKNPQMQTLDESIKPVLTAYRSIGIVVQVIDRAETKLKNERTEIENALIQQTERFKVSLKQTQEQVNNMRTFSQPKKYSNYIEEIEQCKNQLQYLAKEADHINKQQADLGLDVVDYSTQIDTLKSDVQPYEQLWKLQQDTEKQYEKQWNNGKYIDLNPEEVESEHKRMNGLANKLLANPLFTSKPKDFTNPISIASQIKKKMEDFRPFIGVIKALCNDGLRQRHKQEIAQLLGQADESALEQQSITNLKSDLKDKEVVNKLIDISETASKQSNNEKIMAKMKEEWEPLEFTCNQVQGKDSFILSGEAIEVIEATLDDHIIKTQTMKGSPFAKFMVDQVEVWEQTLMFLQDNLELWKKVQSVWMYLEPVFSSEDIINQMPVEGSKFKEVNISWHKLMNEINENPRALTVAEKKDLNSTLKAANNKLETVQKGLNDYLESKRALFPRFFFLSNDELLEILSETKDPLRVQPHLKKCFEGIAKLKFNESKKIEGMYSIEGEYVEFTREIDPEASKGAVEDWLLQVEDVMLRSVKNTIERSHKDYLKQDRAKWIIQWAGQAVLCISMTFWTLEAEEAMKKSGLPGLVQFHERLNAQLNGTVGVVRGDINKLQRATLEALIVLDVHAKEVIKNELIQNEICDPNDFKWLSQLRYYWEDNNVWVKIINCRLEYNYEYLGNSSRLVITALTDRCYRTLCGAIYLTYGGAPEGPAGTGKTETVKDLAKSLSRQCIVFNCSDSLDHLIMAKFFKGMSSCGAWICFDEFNRIELEVLSVVAQQVQSIQMAIKNKVDRFIFEEVDIPIKKTSNCFITMNPGYAGRSELPDNLKALFRSVAMMVPDYTVIAEISLYSFGFTDAKALALKITTTYKLCSEQLSSQDHYDYGMRAVKSVLTAAGNLKRRFMQENESILMLRAINDVNLAKFLAHDLPLFKNITNDLFPGVVLPEPDYKDLVRCMKNNMDKMNLQHHEYFIMKTIQLYEMIIVRHGLMIVGLPFAGKTSCLKVLAAALTQLNEEGLMEECKTHISTLNPKSITMGQLYGNFDEVSHDWTDGVLAVQYRTLAAQMGTDDRRWLVFDGPVDAIWIENMNTVLDDNKKLCLMSGEVIAMSANMNMIFEPMDLAVASPATVSRCGMVYLQPHEMGWHHLYESWKNTLPANFTDDQKKVTDTLTYTLIQPMIDYIRKECKEQTPTEDQCLLVGCLRLWRALLTCFEKEEGEQYYNSMDKKDVAKVIQNSFLFAAIWSICVTVNTEFRRPFDQQFKKIVNGEIEGIGKLKDKILPSAFDRGTIYDYCYSPETGEWKSWMELHTGGDIDDFPKNSVVNEIIVTTVDTIRYGYMLELFIKNEIRSLFVGPTGTGKTAYIQNVLQNKLSDIYKIIEVGFSAQTHCNQVQDIVDMKLDKRRKDYFGPRMGNKCVVFVDDLNMPKKENYGAQPPIEILRQLIDQGGWYDRRDPIHPFRNIIDTMIITAMGTPGGGRSFITPRFQRHFNIIAFAIFDENTMKSIFGSILKWYFRINGFSPDVAGMEGKIITATMKVYDQIQADLKPTPMKTHYTFNLRDFSKVVCGICMATKKELQTADQALRLWAHECSRIFGDRLINNEDRMWMLKCIKECTRNPFGQQFDTVFAHLDTDKNGKVETLDEFRGLLFGDIYTPFGIPIRPYEEILDKQKLQTCADDALFQYNNISDKPMPLVLFNFAIEHLLRIGRILKQPGGHALLVGVGGSGRQSLSRLASKLADFEVYQVEIKKNYRMIEWREDVKSLMRLVGGKGNPTTFLFTDTQIKEEGFLEDVNNILNTGEVPNIFPADEKTDCCEMVRNAAKDEDRCPEGTPQQLFAYFLERCKKFLHVVLCFSPIGASLRNRVRDFPSIVNCTTIDWFSAWPPDALEAVAQKFLLEVEMEDEVRQSCVSMVQTFHTSTEVAAEKFKNELRRIYYVTPTSYLELINTFKSLLAEKREEIMSLKNRYSNGYDCLIDTEQKVNKMQKELEEMQPLLIEAGKETAAKLEIVSKETEAADKVREGVAVEEADAQKIADEANAIKTDCETQLAEALPALEAAERAVNCITRGDIAQLKGMSKPAEDIRLVTKVVCLLMGRKIEKKMNPETQKSELDYWGASIKMMNENDFLKNLINYDKETKLTQELIDSIQQYITLENFKPERLKSVSSVAMNLAMWVFAMDKFFRVNKIVVPKKEQLKIAEAKYADVMKVLSVKQAELKVIVDKVNALKADLQATQDKKADLEARVKDCEEKLIRAESLISGLGGEKTRWKAESERLAIVYNNLTGDVLISSGMIAYLGAFTSVYRSDLAAQWVTKCEEKEIPNSGKFSLERVLGNPVQIRNWGLFGLPNDSFSVENAIINDKTRRWPLFIDPQGQANRWIKNMEKEAGVKVLKFTDGTYLKMLEAGIRMGNPVIIENIGEDTDPAIEPLLQKQIVVKGNSMTIKIGDAIIEYDKNFKFYMTTKLRNPHYLPEVSTKVTLINFMITFEGLSDQLLGIVVEKENPDLQTKKEQLVIEGAKNKNMLQEIEDRILHTLQNSKDILGDATGIEILQNAKVVSDDINKKQAVAEKTEIEIDEARTGYKPVAIRSSGLFFCITDLANIDPMYQYSLDFFKGLFVGAIANSEKSEDLEERLGFLNKEMLESLYRNICRSLFEKDKLIFSMLLTLKLMEMSGEVVNEELTFFLTGGVALGDQMPDIPADWISEKMWGEAYRLDKLKNFKGFLDTFVNEIGFFREMYDAVAPHQMKLPGLLANLNIFQYLLVIRVVRPDMLVPAISDFVTGKIGDYFIVPPAFDLGLIFKDSGPTIPLIFVLSPGADPMNNLQKYADSKKKVMEKISLGKGQGPKAVKAIETGIKNGSWVVLQNCHLAVSWMGTLEKICEDLPGTKPAPHREFRLWLTSYPSAAFPVSILQNGVKMTNEPPMGLKSNLMGSLGTYPISDRSWFDANTQPKVFRKMLFGLCFFHAFIQERRLFGPLGWNIQYQFNESDLNISAQQLSIFIDEYPEKVPLDALNYLTGECNYGGRVTDDKDRRLMAVILKDYYCEEIYANEDYKFSPSGKYFAPKVTDFEQYFDYIKTLPLYPDPEVYGFHDNAAITKNMNETNAALSTILITQQNSGGGGGGNDDALINNLADSILAEIPKPFNVAEAEKKYPIQYEQSMNTVLTQELDRFNGLIKVITGSLNDLKKAIKGEVLLSADLEAALNSLKVGTVPAMWIKKSFPSLKPLGGYIKDLLERLNWFQFWLENGIPDVLWITRFFFTQGFLTGAKQNYARKYNIAIDLLDYDYEVVADEENVKPPEDGINVVGMHIEGCRWNNQEQCLDESEPKTLFVRCPMIWFKPSKVEDFSKIKTYDCPVYKTSVRKGVLMTTGHSTNFVILLRMPTKKDASHWIKRGVAILCSLDD